MASGILRRAWFSWAAPAKGLDFSPPYPVSASGTGTSIAIVCSEALRAGPAFGQWAVTANGVTKAVSAAAVAGSTVTLTVATVGGAGVAVVITYTPGGTPATRLADSGGNEALAHTFSYTS